MQKTARKIHLWVGLILATVLIIEAVTGIIMAEPWLVGQGKQQLPSGTQQSVIEQGKTPGSKEVVLPAEGRKIENSRQAANGLNIVGFAKGLHQGRIGSVDVKWVIDLAAIGLVILTVSGVYIAIPILRARSKKR